MRLVDFSEQVCKIEAALDVFGMIGSPQRKMLSWGILGFFPFFLCGCQPSQSQLSQIKEPEMYTFRAEGNAVLEKADGSFGAKGRDYANVMEVTGRGIPANDAASESEKRFTAIEAAKYRALAKLAEKLEGVNVSLRAEVRDMVFSSEEIEAHIEAHLKGVSLVRSEYNADTGVAEATIRLALDSEGELVQERDISLVSRSKAARRIRAESAARINALGKLLEQIGDVWVGKTIKVRDMMFSSQKAWLKVQGMLEGVEYSEPRWKGEELVTVEAVLKVPREKMEQVDRMRGRDMRQHRISR